MKIRVFVVLTALFILLAPSAARATLVDPAFTETVVVSSPDLALATGLAWAPDGSNRLFVIRKEGQVRIIKDGVLLPDPFATVTPVYTASECGLIGIAFDPDFITNQYVYLFATVSASEQQILRYTASGDVAAVMETLVPNLPTLGVNHDGGALGIGPDGMLYWAIGDNGAAIGAAADLSSLASKVGRARLDGTIPIDNPFYDGAGPNADYIWARGFRNPFTMTFQPTTGLLWVDVVGTNFEQVFVVHKGDHGGWNIFENNQPSGYIEPLIKYRTNGADTITINPAATSGAVRAGGIVTFTGFNTNPFRAGERITVSGVADPSFNGAFYVRAAPAPTIFSVVQPGPDAVSGDGTATTQAIGGCVTGAAFYDSTQFPAAYRGNYFGDFNTGNLARATLDPVTNGITSVDLWGSGVGGAVDMALGPDGGLYYVGVLSNAVYRASYNVTAQALVVSPTHLWMAEGKPAVVTVRMATVPTRPTIVSIARAEGDADVHVVSGSMLVFAADNWSVPQPVVIGAGRDLDTTDDAATIAITADALTTETIAVHVRDDNDVALVASTPALTLDEGTDATFTVVLSQRPSLPVVVDVARSNGDADIVVAVGNRLTFDTSNWATPHTVAVHALVDADGSDDTAELSLVSGGMPEILVGVTARDTADAPVITSIPVTTADRGASYGYQVVATGRPTPSFTLDLAPPDMMLDASSGLVGWTPMTAGSFIVSIRAANGVAPDAIQAFTIEVPSSDAGIDAGMADAPDSDDAKDDQVDVFVGDASNADASENEGGRADGDAAMGAMDAASLDDPPLRQGSDCDCRIGWSRPNRSGAPAAGLALLYLALKMRKAADRRTVTTRGARRRAGGLRPILMTALGSAPGRITPAGNTPSH